MELKQKILSNHTLEAVLSMPDDLFYPVGVITSIIIIKAHQPHPEGYKTYFGYWKDDGFTKKKHQGRTETAKWNTIKKKWLNSFRNRDTEAGFSITKEVSANDEWCAEAYMETDYNSLSDDFFIKKLKEYSSFAFLQGYINFASAEAFTKDANIMLNINHWKEFKYGDIFDIKNGYYNKKPEESKDGEVIFIGATKSNNGITQMCSLDSIKTTKKDGSIDNDDTLENKIYPENAITLSNGGSIGNAFYQLKPFTCAHHVNPIYLKNIQLNPFIGLFLCTLIELEQYRYSTCGREWRLDRMPKSQIKLPTTPQGEPDWQFMENYIKSLPYSSSL